MQFRDHAPFTAPGGKWGAVHSREEGERALERAAAFVRKYHGSHNDRIRGHIFPYTLDQNSTEQLVQARQLATELGVGIKMHFAQSMDEVARIWMRSRKTPVEYLDDLGFLGPDVCLTHCLYIAGNQGTLYPDGRELKLLAERGVHVCNTPWIYAARGGYLNAFGRYQRAGINMLIGTDTHPTDLIREMQYALVMGKTAEQSSTAVTSRDIFNAVTVNPARYLGRSDIGRLTPGARADIVAIDFDRVSLGPVDDPIQSLIFFGATHDVRTVIVDGTTIVDGFRAVGVDEEAIVRHTQPILDKMRRLFTEWDWAKRDPAQRFAPALPIV